MPGILLRHEIIILVKGRPSSELVPNHVVHVDFGAVNELDFSILRNPSLDVELAAAFNELVHLVPQLLIHRQMLHPCCLIDEIYVRLLLLLSIIVDIRFSLQRHPVSLCLQLFIHLLEW
jgi:hypothetical protein